MHPSSNAPRSEQIAGLFIYYTCPLHKQRACRLAAVAASSFRCSHEAARLDGDVSVGLRLRRADEAVGVRQAHLVEQLDGLGPACVRGSIACMHTAYVHTF